MAIFNFQLLWRTVIYAGNLFFYLFFDHLFQITRVLHFHTVDDDDDDDDGAFGDDTIQLHFL